MESEYSIPIKYKGKIVGYSNDKNSIRVVNQELFTELLEQRDADRPVTLAVSKGSGGDEIMKPDCAKHLSYVDGFDGGMEELVEKIGDLRYDTMIEFLGFLESKLKKNGDKDMKDGRVKLADSLHNASTRVGFAKEAIKDSWKHSKPYIK